MLTPTRWALVTGTALAVVAAVGVVQILVTGNGGAAWVIVAVAAASSLAAFGVAARHASRGGPGEQPHDEYDTPDAGHPREDG